MVNELVLATPWLVWGIPLIGAFITAAIGLVSEKGRDYFAVAVSFISAVLASTLLPIAYSGRVIHSTYEWIPSLGIRAGVLADPFSILMANVVGWISFLIMVYSIGYMRGESSLTRYWFFMVFFIGSMQLIVLSDNFLQLFFGWEGVGLASYALIGFWHKDELKHWVGKEGQTAWGVSQTYPPSHAAMKAFLTTKVGDISLLAGILLLFYATLVAGNPTFSFVDLAEDHEWARNLAQAGLFIPVAIMIFGGAVGKSAQFPLHEWLPDAMAGPTAVSALIHAATMVKAGVFLVGRLGPIFYSAAATTLQAIPLFEVIAWIGAFSAFLAASQALVSKELKKVLAYSTMSQIGFMMLALGVAGLSSDFAGGFTASFFHLSSHAVFKAALFMGAGAVLHAAGTRFMDEMGGLRKHMRWTFYAMMIAAFSLAGVPPLSGFWSKDAILAAILRTSSPATGFPLFLVAVVTALMTAFYSFRMLGMVFFGSRSQHLEQLEEDGHHVHEAPKIMLIPYVILAAASLAIGLIGPLFEGRLFSLLEEHLSSSYGIHAAEAVEVGLSPIAIGTSLLILGAGGGLGYVFYMTGRGPPSFIGTNAFTRGLYRFLDNRWYINSFLYHVFVTGLLKIGRGVYSGLEQAGFDRFNEAFASSSVTVSRASDWIDVHLIDGFANGVAWFGGIWSNMTRKIQTGITQNYVLAFILGIVAMIAIAIFVV